MGLSRAQILWNMVKPKAAEEGIVSVRPQVDAIDLLLRNRIKDVQDDLDTAKTRILANTAALDTKAAAVHVHPINQVTGLQAALTTLQARVAALEAKVP